MKADTIRGNGEARQLSYDRTKQRGGVMIEGRELRGGQEGEGPHLGHSSVFHALRIAPGIITGTDVTPARCPFC